MAVESSNTHSTVTADTGNKYWNIADASQSGLDFSTTFTACAWLYNTAANFRNKNWISKGAASNYAYNVGWSDTSPYNYQFYSSANGSTLNVVATLTHSLPLNTWFEIVAVYKGSVPNIEIYIDGVSVGTMTVVDASLYNGTAPFEIAGQFGDGLWDGQIDNVRVYSTALDASTIASNFAAPCNVSIAGLVSQWFFNNDGNDAVGSNNLTGINSPTFSTAVPYSCSAAGTPRCICNLPMLGVG